MRKQFIKTLAFGILFIGTASVANANLIVNGGFEDPGLKAKSWNVYTGITGWTTTGAGIEIHNDVAGSSHTGYQHAELDSHSNSAVQQEIGTALDELYTLSFFYSPRPGVNQNSNDISVKWNNVSLGSIITGSTVGDTSWTQHSFSVFGTGTDTLAFSAEGISDSYGGYLDDVSLTSAPVPEPATMVLFGVGLAGLAGLQLRRRKN